MSPTRQSLIRGNSIVVPVLGTYYLVPTIGTMVKSLHSDEYRRLTDWLKSNREAQNLSMRDLAKKMDVPHSFIGKIEQRERKLDVIEFLHYCTELGISPIDGLRVIDKKIK